MRLRAAVCSVLCVLLFTSCGVRDQPEPAAIASDDIPFGLVDPPLERARGQEAQQTVGLFFLGRDGLVRVDRSIDSEATPALALRELLAGPTVSERDAGAGSALVSSSAARFTRTRDGAAQVALASGFRDSAIGDQPAALAEIVYTLTEFPEIERVSFTVDDKLVSVPRPDGSLAEGPVDRRDYAALPSYAEAVR